jgi:glycopeptide antibiotics resistance protein
MQTFLKLALYFCIAGVFYFSWLPNPSFSNQSYLPQWLIHWTDEYGRLRTAVPFLVIGFVFQYLFKPTTFFTLSGFLLSLLIVFIAEVFQFLLPNRHPDFFDIVFASIGSMLGMILFFLFHFFVKSQNKIR